MGLIETLTNFKMAGFLRILIEKITRNTTLEFLERDWIVLKL